MPSRIRLDDVRRAWEARDPELVGLVEALADQDDEPPKAPIREGAPTFAKLLAEIRSLPFRRKPLEEQAHYRVEQLKALEVPDGRGAAAGPAPAARDPHGAVGRTTARSPGPACSRSSPGSR